MPAITISAAYGAGGSIIAPRVAQQLGFALLDRAISSRVADQLNVSLEEAEAGEKKRSFAERFFGVLAPMAGGVVGLDAEGLPDTISVNDAVEFRTRAEAIMRQALPNGAVILGRAGAAALREEPGVLRVRLFGPAEARARQATQIEDVELAVAQHRQPEVDRARAQYVDRLYGFDIDDARLYHLQLDSTAISIEVCVETITTAYAGLN
jgi:cytidylate kinase